ncbi:GspE/PulE family protein [Arthrobacter sp. A2-55]|uniref:GspE/PulE family protein n=1 Tax=Arthrobacter sp. A2-55 TaxID=2897337 RepID=UPI0021CDC312|nr:GspE/PulE family protein [Arthrobacter sp. A2-55]MCU6480156.1 GspE/PulE family protein [Arthrobacter sp. A2-55]
MSLTRLGKYLVSRDMLTSDEWAQSQTRAASNGKNIFRQLVDQGSLTTPEANAAFAYTQGWTYLALGDDLTIPPEVIEVFEDSFAREHNVLPVALEGGTLTVATRKPSDLNIEKVVRGAAEMPVNLVYSPTDELTRAVHRFYSTSAEAARKGGLAAKALASTTSVYEGIGTLPDQGEIVDTLNIIIEGALRAGASDIHLEPAEHHLSIRYSIDGRPRPEPLQPKAIAPRLASLIKTRAKMLSSELTNQDGAIRHHYNGVNYDIRVAVLPTAWGESITLRLGAEKVRKLDTIGFSTDTGEQWRRSLAQPNGILLAVGPMGSGKTSLNYSSLDHLMGQGRKIVSMEAPVEMKFSEGVSQVSINPKQGLTWEGTMETVLRSAASVLFVGEINREDVAHTAINAAMTGHLVLSTLHTNDAPGAVVRLREMGIRPSVLADSMRAVCAQRLPRLLCSCKVAATPSKEMIRDFHLTPEDLAANEWFGPSEDGCRECLGLGYKGRVPIHELMTFNKEIRDLITDDVPNRVIAAAARSNGMRTLQEDGLLKARAGITSLQEVRAHVLVD